MLGPVELAALSLASYRGVQLIIWDTITQPFRDRLELWHAEKHDSKVRTFVRTLFGCPYCVGVYTSFAAVAVYLLAAGKWGDASWVTHGIEAMAVAGAQALLNRWDDNLGDGH